ncbi:hypothetical protein KSS87_018745 [Heliosperma pusillum]|nr:hypothetical protein KSS87_018745 [Heliosperma pusillum]
MEGKSQSGGSNSGGVVKNRGSSGCLVIKKKLDGSGAGPSGDRKVYESKKAKKRARVSAGDGDSSDEELLEYYRREGGGLGSGSGGYNDFGNFGFSRNRLMREGAMKRSKLDVYDFDEYDDLNEVEMMGARYFFEREMGGGGGSERGIFSPRMEMKSGSGSGDGMDFEGGSSKGDIIYKRRKSFHGNTGGEYYSMGKERFGGSDEAIRLQGKNGVLKVRVKNKEDVNKKHPQMYRSMGGNSVIHRGQELTAKSIIIQRHSPYSERKLPKKPITAGRTDKKPVERRKSWPAKSSESDDESEDGHASAKFQSGSGKGGRPNKRGRRAGSLQSPEISQMTKAREGKVKRGTGTEKQLLREKIRSMLISAGWTIDYRPRRGRDYSDAVYINPSGTAFWSIIKAYDALQKQLEEEGKSLKASDDSSSLAPISEDTLSKLTRQTRQKIEKELKRKKREENRAKKNQTNRNFEEDESDGDSSGSGRPDEKLSSYMKRSGKPSKSSSKDAWRDVGRSNPELQEMGDKSSFRFIHGRKSNKIGRCTLLVRNSEKGHDVGTDGFVPYTGKRNLLSWLIDSGTVELSEKVHYMNRRRTKVMLEGWITRDGIHCGCCSKILTVTKFEIHAASKLRQPFQNIYLSSGPSLLQCQVDTWNKQDESLRDGFNKINVDGDDSNDDTCAICGDGGNLICCDSCPSTFHQNCLDIQVLPPGDWHCPHCSCKLCGLANVGAVEGYDTKEDILLTCSLCERKYHNSCVEMDSSVVSSSALPFCGRICHEVFEKFQKLLGVKHELEDGLCWSLIHRTDLSSDNSLRSLPQRVEWNSKLAVALSIMDECFLPITDRRSGINIIHNVLYNCGSNFTRLNYNGFYTAVLERSDEIISAASIRIHGTQFAEMPFIGTRHIYRRQGMCRRLFSAIESALRSLNVDKLIIPAISELMDTWTRVFGFSTLEESDKREMKTLNMLVFPGTDMLQKKLVDQDGFENDLKGVGSCDAAHNPSDTLDHTQTSDFDSSPGPSIATTSQDGAKMNANSFNSRCSEDMAVSVQGTSPKPRQDVHEQVNPVSQNTSAYSSDEAMPVISGEEGLDTTVSPLQKGMKLESTEHVNDHSTLDTREDDVPENALDSSTEMMGPVRPMDDKAHNDDSLSLSVQSAPGGTQQPISEEAHNFSSNDTTAVVHDEKSQVTTPSPLELDIKLKESSEDLEDIMKLESTEHVNDQVTSDTREGVDVPENAFDSSTEMMGNGLPMDDKAHNDDSLSISVQSAPGGKQQPISEDTHDFCSNDTTPVIPGEKSQVTAPSPLELDIKLKESSEDLEDIMKLESTEHVNDHITSDTREHVDVPENALDSSTEMMCNGLPMDDKAYNDDSLSLSVQSAPSGKQQPISEEAHDDFSSNDTTPVVPDERSQVTTPSPMELDIKLKESSDDLEDRMKLESTEHVNDHITSDTREDVDVPENALDSSTEIMGPGLPMDGKARNDDSLSLSVQSVPGGEQQPISEEALDFSSNDTTAVIHDGKSQVTALSPLELDIKLQESSEDLEDIMKLESTEHVNDYITSDTRENVDVPENALDSSTEIMGPGLPMDGKARNDDSLSLSVQSAPGSEQQPISEEAHDFSSNDTTAVIHDVKSQVTAPSPLELDIKLQESSEDLEDIMKLDSTEHVNEHITSDSRKVVDVPENALDSSTEMMGNGLPMDDKAHNDDSLSLNVQSAPGDKQPPILEEAHDDFSSNDTTPVVPGERSQVTTLSEELDGKLKDSFEDLEDHITLTSEDIDIVEKQDVPVSKITGNDVLQNDASQDDSKFVGAMPVIAGEGIQGATNPCLQLDIQLKESAEDLKDHITSTCEDMDIVGKQDITDEVALPVCENDHQSTNS